MGIPLPFSRDDIYAQGFDVNLNKAIPNDSSGVVYDSVKEGINTSQILPGGNLNLKTLSIGGLVRQVAPGDDIQAAIDAVSREGGGTVQLLSGTFLVRSIISLRSNVALRGAGRGITVINFGSSNSLIQIEGTLSLPIQNWAISDMSIVNSGYSAAGTFGAIYATFADNFRIENVYVTGSSKSGIVVSGCKKFSIFNVECSSNVDDGIFITGATNRNSEQFTVAQAVCDSNDNGLSITQSYTPTSITRFTILNCSASNNTTYGFVLATLSDTPFFGGLVGCSASGNLAGFYISGSNVSFVSCFGYQNTGIDFYEISFTGLPGRNIFVACHGTGSPLAFVPLATETILVGNFTGTGTVADQHIDTSTNNKKNFKQQKVANTGGSAASDTTFLFAYNNSGGSVPIGSAVQYGTATFGGQITFTTSTGSGSNRVFGVATEAIQGGAYGYVAVRGVFSSLEAGYGLLVNNGAASIAVGDFLSMSSSAYYAKRAATGDTVFAIALSTPTTSTAQIAAQLISPRLI